MYTGVCVVHRCVRVCVGTQSCVCVYTGVCTGVCVVTQGCVRVGTQVCACQKNLQESVLFFRPWDRALNPGCQTWQQVPVSAEPSQQPFKNLCSKNHYNVWAESLDTQNQFSLEWEPDSVHEITNSRGWGLEAKRTGAWGLSPG